MNKYKAKRLRKWLYEYRSFQIECIGYYPPEGRVVWEAIDTDGTGFAHAYTLRECKMWIDTEIENQNNLTHGTN